MISINKKNIINSLILLIICLIISCNFSKQEKQSHWEKAKSKAESDSLDIKNNFYVGSIYINRKLPRKGLRYIDKAFENILYYYNLTHIKKISAFEAMGAYDSLFTFLDYHMDFVESKCLFLKQQKLIFKYNLGKIEEVIKASTKELDKEEQLKMPFLYTRAFCYLDKEEFDKAIKDFETLYDLYKEEKKIT